MISHAAAPAPSGDGPFIGLIESYRTERRCKREPETEQNNPDATHPSGVGFASSAVR